MNNFESIYFKIAYESASMISQKTGNDGYLYTPENFDINSIHWIDLKEKHDFIISEEIYRKSIFDSFINLVKSKNLFLVSFDEMKRILGRKLNPIKIENKVFIFKFDFSDKKDFIKKINSSFNNSYFNRKDFFDNLYNGLLKLDGACWKPFDDVIVMFLNEQHLNNIVIMHECIHYIQNTTVRSMLKQVSSTNNLFNESEFYAYLNSLCHLIEENNIDYKDMFKLISDLQKNKIYFDDFDSFKNSIKNTFIKNVLNESSIIWLLMSIFYDKNISLIKNHLLIYFKN